MLTIKYFHISLSEGNSIPRQSSKDKEILNTINQVDLIYYYRILQPKFGGQIFFQIYIKYVPILDHKTHFNRII